MAGLLAHCAKARSARPSARWQKACRQRLDAVADASALLCALLDLVVTTEPITFLGASWRRPVLIGYNERLVRGLVWAVGVLDPDWLAQALPEVAVPCLQLGRGRGYPPKPVPGTKIPSPASERWDSRARRPSCEPWFSSARPPGTAACYRNGQGPRAGQRTPPSVRGELFYGCTPFQPLTQLAVMRAPPTPDPPPAAALNRRYAPLRGVVAPGWLFGFRDRGHA